MTDKGDRELPDVTNSDALDLGGWLERWEVERPEQQLGEFYQELLNNAAYTRHTARYKAVVVAYARGENVQDICDTFDLTRTDLALIVRTSGVKRGMDQVSMAPADVANLYAMLYAAQLEIESLRRELAERDGD